MTACASLLPGGRLTLLIGSAEMPQNADYSGSILYYAPFVSDVVPIFNNGDWGSWVIGASPFDQVGLALSAPWAANARYDVFIALSDGSPILGTGAAWQSDSMVMRGIIRRNGLMVNQSQIQLSVNGGQTLSVPACEATFVGSINVGPAPGLLEATFALGQNRRCDVWNAYNQREIRLGVGCPPPQGLAAVSWKPDNQYPAWKPFNNDISNSGWYFTGIPQNVECVYLQRCFIDSLNYGYCAAIATICKDSISSSVGTWNSFSSDTLTDAMGISGQAVFCDRSSIGAHRVIMGTANANSTDGATMWGLVNAPGRTPEDTHVMWIRYMG